MCVTLRHIASSLLSVTSVLEGVINRMKHGVQENYMYESMEERMDLDKGVSKILLKDFEMVYITRFLGSISLFTNKMHCFIKKHGFEIATQTCFSTLCHLQGDVTQYTPLKMTQDC
jgi:hypothetical protein